MSDAQRAIISIYDTATVEAHWDIALDECVGVVGARSASLSVVESDPDVRVRHDKFSAVLRGLGAGGIVRYGQNFARYEHDGWEHVLGLPKQTLVTDKEVWTQSDAEIVRRADFAFLLEHAGILRRVVARLNDNRAWSDNIAFQFDHQLTTIPAQSMSAARSLLPHMAKAVELGRSFSILRSRYAAVLTALDFVEVGLCITLPSGTVIVANAEAERILGERDGITRIRNDRLTARDGETDEALRRAIAEASATASGAGDRVEFSFSVRRSGGRHPCLVEVSPLRDAAAELERGLSGAIVTLIDPDNPAPLRIERLAALYGLTKAETSVAKLLLSGWTNGHIAEERGVSIDTVKTQIAGIMHKTETRRRSELIRLVLRVSPPIRDRAGVDTSGSDEPMA